MIGAAAGLFAAVAFTGGAASVLATPLMSHLIVGLALGGAAMEAGAIATALTSNRGMNITTRQAAAFRQVIYGEQRVGGGVIYQSTTGGSLAQYNYVIVFTNHVIDSMVNLYLDGRQVFFTGSGPGNYTRNGVNFGGNANGNTYTGPNGNYNFGGMVYCAPYFGDQTDADGTVPGGGFDTGLQANDPTWSPSAQGIPYVAGCSYMYLKVEYNPTMFPSPPEVRVTIRGKNDIYDPRTGTRGYSNNAALCVADIYSSTAFLLNEAVNEAQLIAAANVCDEAIDLAAGGTEPQFCCNYHFDTGTAAGDVIPEMLKSMAGRVSRIGGEIYLFPAYWQVRASPSTWARWRPTSPGTPSGIRAIFATTSRAPISRRLTRTTPPRPTAPTSTTRTASTTGRSRTISRMPSCRRTTRNMPKTQITDIPATSG
jgi:hypothetical protein